MCDMLSREHKFDLTVFILYIQKLESVPKLPNTKQSLVENWEDISEKAMTRLNSRLEMGR